MQTQAQQRTLAKIKALVVSCSGFQGTPVDNDWFEFLADEIFTVRTTAKTLPDFKDAMKCHLAAFPELDEKADGICSELWLGLTAGKIIRLPDQPAPPEDDEPKGCPEVIPVSLAKFQRVFRKEIDNRKRSKPDIPDTILQCQHDWFHDITGGERCMVCDFETTKQVWNCQNCSVQLCGSCCFKWKKNI